MPYRHRPRRRRRFLADLVEPGATFDGFGPIGPANGVWRRPDHLGDVDAGTHRGGGADTVPRLGALGRTGPVGASVATVAVVAVVAGVLALGSGRSGDGTGGPADSRAFAADTAPRPDVPAPTPAPAPASYPVPATAVSRTPAVPRGEVVVLDQGRTPGAARALTDRLTAGGWRVTGTAVWRGRVPATTVYFPAGREAEARALAQAFPEIRRVRPSFTGITHARVAVIVVDGPSGPLPPPR